jgi:hypothetical protein
MRLTAVAGGAVNIAAWRLERISIASYTRLTMLSASTASGVR